MSHKICQVSASEKLRESKATVSGISLYCLFHDLIYANFPMIPTPPHRSLTAFTNASFSEDSPPLAPTDTGVRPSASAPAALAAAQPLYTLHRKSSGAAASGAAVSGVAASGATASGAAASGAAASGAAASGAASGSVSPMANPRSLQWLEELESGEWTHRSPTSAASYVCER
jgi:hypothetical protein